MPELQFDLARNQKQDSEAFVPAGDSTKAGYRLTWVGPGPLDFDWVQDAESQILKGVGDPNGVEFAPKGTLYVERDVPALWQNDDGLASWAAVGSGGSGLLTDSYYEFIDDGTTTGNAYNTGDIANTWDAVSGFNNGSDVYLDSGRVTIATTGIYSCSVTWDVLADAGGDTYNYARGRFTADRTNEPGSPVHDQVFLDDLRVPVLQLGTTKHAAYFSASFVGFMYATDIFFVETVFRASSPGITWSYETASMYVERLA